MGKRFALLGLSLMLAMGPAQADEPLRRLLGADEARAWRAVGRLNIGGNRFCTGALIAEDLVLTAAHCVYSKRTGKRVAPEQIHFLAGWRKGWAAAHRKAQRVVVHPSYDYRDRDQMARISADLALIELDQPIRDSVVAPFERIEKPKPGDVVTVVSYARDRAEVPSLQEECEMLGRQSDVLVLSCDVNFGASGAPIFVMEDGQPRVASVVSAMAQWNDRDVALGTSLGDPLDDLMARLRGTSAVYQPHNAAKPRPLPQVGGVVNSAGRKVIIPPQ